MKKRIFALLATLILTFAFATTCFAAPSPSEEVLPTEETTENISGGNTGSTSPKTGVNLAGAFVVVITASGIALVSHKINLRK